MILSPSKKLWGYFFNSPNKSVVNESSQRELWKNHFQTMLKSDKCIDALWNDSLRLSRSLSFSPNPLAFNHLEHSLRHLPSHCVNGQICKTSYLPNNKTIALRIITKIWHNTLKLFTWNQITTDLENKNLFNLGSFSVKIFDLTRIVSFIAINTCATELAMSFIVNPTLSAYLITIASVVVLAVGAFFLINRYAEHALSKPLKDPTFGDTINLTKLMSETIPMSEAGRRRELDDLEAALLSTTAEVGVIGEKGCGKTELIKLLAQRITHGTCSAQLKDKQVYCVNGSQVSRNYLEKLRESIKGHEEDVILCIDEAHGIFKAGADQILKTLGMGGPKPRIIYLTTKDYFESTFASEKDGSWLSRIHPRIEVTAINKNDLHFILLARLQSILPWVQITPEIIEPFVEIGQKELRKAIKQIDLFASHFLKKLNSSEILSQALEEKTKLEAQLSSLSLRSHFHEWVSSKQSHELCQKISHTDSIIFQEKQLLREREIKQKEYQAFDLLQKKWQAKIQTYWHEGKSKSKEEKDKHLFASSLWAGEVFQTKKDEIARCFQTRISSNEVLDFLTEESRKEPLLHKKHKTNTTRNNPNHSNELDKEAKINKPSSLTTDSLLPELAKN